MSIGVFSDIGKSSISNQNNGKIKSEQEEKNSVPKKEVFLNKAKNIAPYVVPLAAIPITALITYKISAKNINSLKGQISNLSQEISVLREQSKSQADKIANNLKKQTIKSAKNS